MKLVDDLRRSLIARSRHQVWIVLISVCSFANTAHAVCPVEEAGFTTDAPVHVHENLSDAVEADTLLWRDLQFIVFGLISPADAQRVVDAMGLDIPVSPVGPGGTVPLGFDLIAVESRRYLSGPCADPNPKNTKPYSRVIASMNTSFVPATSTFNVSLAGFWSNAPAPVNALDDTNAKVEARVRTRTEDGTRAIQLKAKLKSADKVSTAEWGFEYVGNLPFVDASSDSKGGSLAVPLYGVNQESGLPVKVWCSRTRTRATLLSSDPNLLEARIKVGPRGEFCFNQLEDAQGTVCVNFLTDEKNRPMVPRIDVVRVFDMECETVPAS